MGRAVPAMAGRPIRKIHQPERVAAEKASPDNSRDHNGRLWVGTGQVLFLLVARPDPKQSVIERAFTTRQGMPDNWTEALLQSSDGRIWVGTASGLAELSPTGEAEVGNSEAMGPFATLPRSPWIVKETSGWVTLAITVNDHQLRAEIVDDGCGFSQAPSPTQCEQERQGNGLSHNAAAGGATGRPNKRSFRPWPGHAPGAHRATQVGACGVSTRCRSGSREADFLPERPTSRRYAMQELAQRHPRGLAPATISQPYRGNTAAYSCGCRERGGVLA